MKRIYLILIVLVGISVSCTKNFEDWQKDEKHPSVVDGEMLFTNAQKALADQVASSNVNLNNYKLYAQYWTETTYTDEANYDLINRSIPDNVFRVLYRDVLRDLREATTIITETPLPPGTAEEVAKSQLIKENKLLLIDVLEVYTFQRLVDIFGNVPYSEALDIDATLNPGYDDGLTIYKDLVARLDNVIAKLNMNSESYGSTDLYYQGDVVAWSTFAQSLKLRLAISIADVDEVKTMAQAWGEAAAAKTFSSSAEDAKLVYETAPLDNTNPIYQDLVASGRKDFIPANTVVNYLNDYQDPRMYAFIEDVVAFSYETNDNNQKIDTELVGGERMIIFYETGESEVVDLPYLVLAVDSLTEFSYFKGGVYGSSSSFGSHSHVGSVMLNADFPIQLMSYTEILFLKAEAAARGWAVGGTAEEFYYAGITASFNEWSVEGSEDYIATEAVVWDPAGDWKKMIGMQAYFAYYQRGFEGWTTYRRLDWPVMNVPEGAITEDGGVPRRFTFPVNEQTLNSVNYYQAADAVGGDKMETKLFWDKF